jgi:hypothetical protein
MAAWAGFDLRTGNGPSSIRCWRHLHAPGGLAPTTGVAERTGLRDLQDLVTKGLLVVRGKKRGSRYFLP